MPAGEAFLAGGEYTVEIILHPADGVIFDAKENIKVRLNDVADSQAIQEWNPTSILLRKSYALPEESCMIRYDANGGSGEMERARVMKGTKYTLPPCFSPRRRARNSTDGTWVTPGDKVEITDHTAVKAQWKDRKELKANPFEDVEEADYFYEAVLWAYYAAPQVTNGMDATHFGPEETVTRGQAVTFLWRAMGCPEPVSTASPFEDVTEGKYYYKAVLWAVEKGITNGTDATHFTPGQTCSTAHIITFLYRTMGIGANGWYAVAEAWAQGAGLLNGLNVTVAPGVDCPRSDVVLFLCRALAE